MKTIGLAPNPKKVESVQLACELAMWLAQEHVRPLLLAEIAHDAGCGHFAADDEELLESDMLVILGGDGTMLRWARLAVMHGTPMLGVNFGQYGFITEIHPQDSKSALRRVIEGSYRISERIVLKAVVKRNEQLLGTFYGINDVVVSKGPMARMLGLHTYVNGKYIVKYAADGIIVASPTGSTAYSLSAGGPVVHPDVGVLIMTPICPHTMNARSLVIPDSGKVQIVGESSEDGPQLMLTVDGQLSEHLENSDMVEVSKAEFAARLIQLDEHSFYNKLQNRLRWGERFSG